MLEMCYLIAALISCNFGMNPLYLGPRHIVLVNRDRNRRKNADDRNHDHQFDKGEASTPTHNLHLHDDIETTLIQTAFEKECPAQGGAFFVAAQK
ncbi:hypothetical protein SAMN05216576_111127 [Ectopseudomonas chengduensis]|uniref:Uncharacterized protein n=1 Tax=Ectopseudomonas chengduensis TaxID=489632 RepID=A0A1G6SBL8_9GAMM|nr:hypothetical protein SAMN05216576_111127 [Pseudomonas chengduensis]